jgi:hypothetical protein
MEYADVGLSDVLAFRMCRALLWQSASAQVPVPFAALRWFGAGYGFLLRRLAVSAIAVPHRGLREAVQAQLPVNCLIAPDVTFWFTKAGQPVLGAIGRNTQLLHRREPLRAIQQPLSSLEAVDCAVWRWRTQTPAEWLLFSAALATSMDLPPSGRQDGC